MTPPTQRHFRSSAALFTRRLATFAACFCFFLALTLILFACPALAAQSQSASSGPASPEPSPLKKAVRKKKVITEDDLAQPPKLKSDDVDQGEEDNPVCDYSCQSQIRAEFGFGYEREAEFQNQLTLARHDIAGDKRWLNLLDDARKTGTAWCVIQEQKTQILSKGDVPQYTRDNINSQFSDREGKLVQQFHAASGLVVQHIQTLQRIANFRATVMQYQFNGIVAHLCAGHPLP